MHSWQQWRLPGGRGKRVGIHLLYAKHPTANLHQSIDRSPDLKFPGAEIMLNDGIITNMHWGEARHYC